MSCDEKLLTQIDKATDDLEFLFEKLEDIKTEITKKKDVLYLLMLKHYISNLKYDIIVYKNKKANRRDLIEGEKIPLKPGDLFIHHEIKTRARISSKDYHVIIPVVKIQIILIRLVDSSLHTD